MAELRQSHRRVARKVQELQAAFVVLGGCVRRGVEGRHRDGAVVCISANAAMEVCFLSGETRAALAPDEFEGKTAKAVKQALEVQIGVTRFRQRLFSEHGSEVQDDEVFASAPVKLQMVVLGFYPADAPRNQQVISASIDNDLVALEKFLNRPSNPNVTDEHGYTPLHYAARNGHVESMLLLLEAGAEKDPPSAENERITPLYIAAQNGHLVAVRHLVEVGADKERADNEGATPLYIAAHNGHLDVVR
eukprot:s627_g17.t1